MDAKEKLELIKRNTVEILGEKELLELLKSKKQPVVYLGTAATGSPHVAYFTWAIKIADFIKAGCKAKILLADLHGALDNTPWEILEKRFEYYQQIIPLLFEAIGVDTKQIEFVKGSEFQLKKEYFLDLMKLTTFISVHDAHKAASEVVKMGDNPKLSGLLYPLMQALDEEYLKCDIQYGGNDQRKIFVLAKENLSKVGYEERVHVMTPILPGLIGKKMSASNNKSKIDLLDDEKTVQDKIRAAECIEGDPENGIMAFMQYVIFVIREDNGEKVTVKRPAKFGGDLVYDNYAQLEKDFIEKKVHPLDVKNTLAHEINELLAPIRKKKSVLEKYFKAAYP